MPVVGFQQEFSPPPGVAYKFGTPPATVCGGGPPPLFKGGLAHYKNVPIERKAPLKRGLA